MFESAMLIQSVNVSNSFPTNFVSICLFILCFCLLCVCVFAKTYIFFLICVEMSLVILCFSVLYTIPFGFGITLSFLLILLAAGETALLLVMVFSLGETLRFVPFVNRLHTQSI